MIVNIVTLWNTGKYYIGWNKKDPSVLFNKEYIEYRLELFEKITLQSLLNQTDINFNWLIFSNTRYPKFCQFFKLVKSSNLNFEIIETNEVNPEQLDDFIGNILTTYTSDVLEFKLDSDDGLSSCFVEEIKKIISTNHSYYQVYYPLALVYLYDKKLLFKNYDKNVLFPVLFKSGNNKDHIYMKRHYQFHDDNPIYLESNNLFYIYTRHKFNHNSSYTIKSERIKLNGIFEAKRHLDKLSWLDYDKKYYI